MLAFQPPAARLAEPEGGWPSLEAYVQAFMAAGAPLSIPWDAEVVCSDDATAICLHRQGRFQVELYLIHPGIEVPSHSHPGMEVVTMMLGGGGHGGAGEAGLSGAWGRCSPVVRDGDTHGGEKANAGAKGYAMLAFQRWAEGVPMTSAAAQWQGETAGPMQEALIRRHHPGAYMAPGFADITGSRMRPEPIL